MVKRRTVEVLYPAYGNQGGDNGNVMYLQACLPEAEFVCTSVRDEPAFAHRHVDMIVMGNMTERQQLRAIDHLRPHASRLVQLADEGVPMLFTGTAAEILGKSINDPEEGRLPALGLLDFNTRRCMPKRFKCGFLGTFDPGEGADPTTLVGFKIQFTQMVGNNTNCAFARVERGWGLSTESTFEGFRYHNLIATWLLGPVLTSNPDLALWLLGKACEGEEVHLAYEDVIREAYRRRLAEFRAIPAGKDVVF